MSEVVEEKEQVREKADVVELPVRQRFNSGEINSLFLGLCRLVRRTAVEEAEEHYKRKLAMTESRLLAEIKNLRLINRGLIEELARLNAN